MIDKKNLDILNSIIKNKNTLLVAFASDENLPKGFKYDYRKEDLYWLLNQGYIKYINHILDEICNSSRTGEILTTTEYLYANVEATPEGRALAEMLRKERKETFLFKWIPLILSILAMLISIVSINISNSRMP